jgi:hypothetical protein
MSFTLYLNSENGTKVNAGSTQAVSYNFNWSVLDNNASYELAFSFASKDGGALTAGSQFALRLNGIGGLNNSYNITSNGAATSTEIIGTISPQSVANTHYLYAAAFDNPPVFFKNRPSGNNFRVEIMNLVGNTIPVFTAEWALVLFFKKL